MAVKDEELGHKVYKEAGVNGTEQFRDVAWELMGGDRFFGASP